MSVQLLSTIGMDPLITAGTPGVHGAVVIGTQGMGVSTPSAAEVAAATVGLDVEVQAPNGAMLTIGAKHEVFAEGTAGVIICPLGITTRLEGATPKEHIMLAPMQTAIAMRHHT